MADGEMAEPRRAARHRSRRRYDACHVDVPLRRAARADEIAATIAWLSPPTPRTSTARSCPSTAGTRRSTWPRSRSAGLAMSVRRRSPGSRSRPSTSSAGARRERHDLHRPLADRRRSRSPRSRAAASARPTSRVAAAADAFPAWAALGAAGRAAYLHRLADLIDANVERLAAVECADMAMLLRSLRARVINRGARNYRAYADLAVALRGARVGVERHAQPRAPDAERSRRRDHAVERAIHALDLEDSAGARRRQHRRSSSPPSGRRSRARSSATSSRRPASRPVSSTSSRGSARRSARR